MRGKQGYLLENTITKISLCGEFFCEKTIVILQKKLALKVFLQMTFSICVIVITVVALLASIVTDKRIKIGKKSIGLYCLIPPIGAILLLIGGRLSWDTLVSYFIEDSSVNPIKILLLFLSMTVFSIILDEAGFFTYVASCALRKTSGSQNVLFFELFATVALLTIFTSNDVVILTVTPFVIAFCKKADCNPLPHLLLEFITANTWSMLLIVGNPTNIYIASAFQVTFWEYLMVMVLPTLASGIVSVVMVYLLFSKSLAKPIKACEEASQLKDKPLALIAGLHLVLCVFLLAISNFLKIEMWIISVSLAVSLLICSLLYLVLVKKPLKPLVSGIKRLPYEIIPFVVGMFVIVLCVKVEGLSQKLYTFLQNFDSVFAYGIGTALASNLINNIPASVLFSEILANGMSAGAIYATTMGSNIGAYITPVGALAGIMWHNILSHNGIKFPFSRFCVYGMAVGVPTLLVGLIILNLVV